MAKANIDQLKGGAGKYRILFELGQGGMSEVYLSVMRGPGGFTKLQVVKRLRPDLARSETMVRLFMDEARLAGQLNHPHIVQTNEVGYDGSHYFIAMEYLDGESFQYLIVRSECDPDRTRTEA
jgi:serine/threonine-protein kinase